MKHRLLLYILKFENHELIKIGITTELRKRIAQLRQMCDNPFDLVNSFIITGRKETVKILESQMLDDLRNDIPNTFPFQVDRNQPGNGITEVRLSRNLEIALDLVRGRVKLNTDIKIYKGIDFSGFYSAKIPRDFYPHNQEVGSILKPIGDLVNLEAQKLNIDPFVLLNEILFDRYKSQIQIKASAKSNFPDSGYFRVPHPRFKSDQSK